VAARRNLEAMFIGEIFAIRGNGFPILFIPDITDALEE
jgi:hypothetical protein